MGQPYILVTGASSELGTAICKLLSEGKNLILHGRKKEKLVRLKKNLDNSDNHIIWVCDFAIRENIADCFIKFLDENNIKIKAIIHVAGIADFKPVRLINRDSIMDSFCINFFSILDIISVAVKKQYKHCMDSIVLISSVSVHSSTGKGMGAYISSKAAMEFYGKAIAAEIAPIRINSIALGGFNNNKEDGITQMIDNNAIEYPLGKGEPKNITGIVEYLLSDKSNWVTGQTFIIDGGYTVFR